MLDPPAGGVGVVGNASKTSTHCSDLERSSLFPEEIIRIGVSRSANALAGCSYLYLN